MPETDLYAIIAIHIGILVLTLFAIIDDFKARLRSKSGMGNARVTRGERSMHAIYTVYGATIASCLFLIEATSSVKGNKVVLIAFDFLAVTYLFFFSSWFRNVVFFPLKGRIITD